MNKLTYLLQSTKPPKEVSFFTVFGVAPVLENPGKSWNWQKRIPGPGKSLNLSCGPSKSWNVHNFSPLPAKNNQNELFVTTGHTFNVTVFENVNGGSIIPQKQILQSSLLN